MTPLQARMARSALRMTVREVAEAAGLTATTVVRYENEKTGGYAETVRRMREVMETRGIEFIGDTGVNVRK